MPPGDKPIAVNKYYYYYYYYSCRRASLDPRENRFNDSHNLLKGAKWAWTRFWAKFGAKDRQVIQPRGCGFSKEGRSERHALPKDRNEVVHVLSIFFSPDLNKIRYKRRPQNVGTRLRVTWKSQQRRSFVNTQNTGINASNIHSSN